MTNNLSGISSRSNAPVESIIRGSSGKEGIVVGWEPAAMMACSKDIVVLPPAPSISIIFAEINLPVPCTTSTLRCLAIAFRPVVNLLTILTAYCPTDFILTFDVPRSRPCSFNSLISDMTLAMCNSALEGIQPTLRQTPPSVS